jgi:DNA-binding response OmpR family regulator
MKILLIEDEMRLANLIKTGLEELGYRTTLASDGWMGRKLA